MRNTYCTFWTARLCKKSGQDTTGHKLLLTSTRAWKLVARYGTHSQLKSGYTDTRIRFQELGTGKRTDCDETLAGGRPEQREDKKTLSASGGQLQEPSSPLRTSGVSKWPLAKVWMNFGKNNRPQPRWLLSQQRTPCDRLYSSQLSYYYPAAIAYLQELA